MDIKSIRKKIFKVFLKAMGYICAGTILILIILYLLHSYTNLPLPLYDSQTVSIWAKCDDKDIMILKNEEWEKFIINGVTLEDAVPGKLEDQDNITYEMFMDWLSLIDEMNANTVQVHNLMSPNFYRALYDYNINAQDPLYLLQGITLKDEEYGNMLEAYTGNMLKLFKKKYYNTIDAIHGNNGFGSNSYKWDVSDWTLGYIVGSNWDPDLVLYTNDISADQEKYNGKFITAWSTASAFENILATIGDQIFSYETGRYGQQRLLGFINWPRTDPIPHDSSWGNRYYENISHVNIELMSPNESVHTGIFVAYQINPNYPLFLSLEPTYSEYIDEEGNKNPYKGYLKTLNEYHRFPVIVSDFGVPSSRGVSNLDDVRGYNQGYLNEDEQGRILRVLYQDIIDTGFAGGCISTWNDNWGKTVWNTSHFVNIERINNWSDTQTSTQSYGLLAYEPGKERSICYIDGDISEWEKSSSIVNKDGNELQMMYDEKYVYFHVIVPDFNFGQDSVYISLDITPESGGIFDLTNSLSFDRPMDFVIAIDDLTNSRILVHEYYNSVNANYGKELGLDEIYIDIPSKNSGQFDLVKQYLRQTITDINGNISPAVLFDTGLLKYGNSNPDDLNYDSLADYIVEGNHIELRIPWALLNFSDPSKMMIHDDYFQNYKLEFMHIDELFAALIIKKPSEAIRLPSGRLALEGWSDNPSWHTRLKKSYYYVQDLFAEYSMEQ